MGSKRCQTRGHLQLSSYSHTLVNTIWLAIRWLYQYRLYAVVRRHVFVCYGKTRYFRIFEILTGSLLNHKTVLTAAHCIKDSFEHVYQGAFYTLKIRTNNYYPTWESMFAVYTGSNDKRPADLSKSTSGVVVNKIIKVNKDCLLVRWKRQK